jgi:multidrug efflux pump subunit AcrA (membrane-fusion protein)
VPLVFAVLLALAPLSAFADESSEFPASMTPDQAMVAQAEEQIDAAQTAADKANATAIYDLRVGQALASAQQAINDAQGMVNAHPGNTDALAQLAAAQSLYAQTLAIVGIESPGMTHASPDAIVQSESLEPVNGFTFLQGGAASQAPSQQHPR